MSTIELDKKMTDSLSYYSQMIEIIKSTFVKNLEILNEFQAYFNKVNELIATISNSAKDFQSALNGINESSPHQKSNNNVQKKWKYLNNSLDIITIYEFPSSNLHLLMKNKIIPFINYYHRASTACSEKAENYQFSVKNAERKAEEAHQKYFELGEQLKSAYNSNQTENLPLLKNDFIAAQNNAYKLHKEENIARLKFCENMETLLTDFEMLEKYRLGQMKSIYLELSDHIDKTSVLMLSKSTELESILKTIQPDCDSKLIMQLSLFKDAVCSPLFQPFSVDCRITQYLDFAKVFKSDIAQGARIGSVKSDYSDSELNSLIVEKDEMLLVKEKVDDKYLCTNINGLIGFVPEDLISFSNH